MEEKHMKRKLFAGLLAFAVAWLPAAESAAVYAAQQNEPAEIPELEAGTYVKGEALVSMTTTEAAALTKEGSVSFDKDIQVVDCWDFGAAEGEPSEGVQDYVALLKSEKYTTEELMEIASERYYVDEVSPNSYATLCSNTNDEFSAYQWYLDGEDAISANSEGVRYSKSSLKTGNNAVVAVVDTGVDYTNPELQSSMWENPYKGKGLQGTCGYDFADKDDDPLDEHGHGTHCAGIIAAQTNNGTGISGLCDAKIMALKVVNNNDEKLETASIVAAFEYIVRAQSLGVNIAAVNCSWGGGYDVGNLLESLINKIGRNGALTVFAAGNDSVNWDAVYENRLETPYDIDSPYVVIVGASNEKDRRAFYSDYGKKTVDLFAPGSNILSTVQTQHFFPQIYNRIRRMQATSYYNAVSDIAGLYTASEIDGIETHYKASIDYTGDQGYPDNANGSIYFRVKYDSGFLYGSDGGAAEDSAYIYLDVTDMNLNPSATYYVSLLLATDEGQADPDWSFVEKVSTEKESRFVTVGGKTYLRIIGIQTTSREETAYYIDDIAVSTADPDTSQFEKYDIMSGSSMAAPMVSAAAAILVSANPRISADKIQAQLLKCVRTVSGLKNACITGGILDMSKLSVLAAKLTLNRTSATVRYGRTLQLRAKITPSNVKNAKVRWVSGNTKYAVVTSSGKVKVRKAGIGKTVKITAVTTDGTGLKKTCKIKILSAKKK